MRQFVLTLSLACIALFSGPVPIGHAQSDMGGGMMGGGMGEGAPDNRTAANIGSFAVVELPIDERVEELSSRHERVTVFHYELGSYKPTVQQGKQAGKSSIEIMAFETQPDEENQESQIEVLVPLELAVNPSIVTHRSQGRIIKTYEGPMGMGGMGMGGEGGYGGGTGIESGGMGLGSGMEGGAGGSSGGAPQPRLVLHEEGMEGGGMGGMGMGGMMGGTMQSPARCYVPLATLAQAKQQTGAKLQLPQQEVEVVSSVIRQNITRRQLVESLHRDLSDTVAVEKIEVRLKQLLAEEYDTQLKRQELEISEIEKRASELRQELGRRKNAKNRVVDVQLGRIILEAQGLLGK